MPRPGGHAYGHHPQGALPGDQTIGRWINDGYRGETGPAGTFRMWRILRSTLTDSALHRSRRAQREWDSIRP